MTDGLTASDVAVLTGNTRNNDGFNGDGCWWIILFLLFGMFGWGGYGFGGGFGYRLKIWVQQKNIRLI